MTPMSEHQNQTGLPRTALIAIFALVAFAIVAVMTGRYGEVGRVSMAPSTEVDKRSLQFLDRADGAVEVYDTDSGARIHVVAPETGGFVRGVLRGLTRERKLAGETSRAPFVLRRWADGRLTLEDPRTGRVIDLGAFGVTNAGAFATLMTSSETAQ